MQKKNLTWLIALALVLVSVGAYVVVERFSGDDKTGRKIQVKIPQDPIDAGKDEPGKIRVYVDNSGPRSSVSVRTPERPWRESLDITVNASKTRITRGAPLDVRTTPTPGADCQPAVDVQPWSLLTRLSWPSRCFTDSHMLDVSVAVDGGKAVEASAERAERSNVLMIMVDDMRTDELQWMPNVQKLIGKQGVTFTNGFAGYPLCCPARASVLTGLYPHNHGVWSHEPPWGFGSLQDEDTAPVWLQRAGYHTTYLGKYLNGYGNDPEPGKDSGTSTQYVPPGWDLWHGSIDGGLHPSDPDNGGTYRYFDTTLNDNGNGYVALSPEYQTTAYTRLTREQLAENAREGKPFFSYVSFTAPHHGIPHEPDDPEDLTTPARPRRIRGAYDELITKAPGADWKDPDRSDKPKTMRTPVPSDDMKAQMLELTRQRAEAIYLVDESVKKIIGALQKNGQLDNTLVVFTSDNGYFLGEQGRPQGKVLPYEPSLRVPVVMRGPGIPKGEIRTDPFLSIDYAPTLADLADARANPKVDGRSLVDVARLGDDSSGPTWSRVVLTETGPTHAAQEALAAKQPVGAHQTHMMLGKVTGIRTGRYLYTEWQPEPGAKHPGILVELYDVLADPEQYVNLAVDGKHEALLREFHEVLGKARRCVAAECRRPLPENLR
jgi:arylsulfatase A-like enzyme